MFNRSGVFTSNMRYSIRYIYKNECHNTLQYETKGLQMEVQKRTMKKWLMATDGTNGEGSCDTSLWMLL